MPSRYTVVEQDWSLIPDEEVLEYHELNKRIEERLARRRGDTTFTYQRRGEAYWDDPVAWAYDCIDWPDGTKLGRPGLVVPDKELTVARLAPYQEEILTELHAKKRAAVRGPHGLGKTCDASLAVLHFALTRDAAGADWKCPTTASVWRQLEDYLWPEIRKWARLIRWDVVGREPFDTRTELLKLNLKLKFGAAFALASDEPSAMEGAHADEILYLFDEAKAITDATFDAAEGAFSTAGVHSGTNAMALAISTPGEPVGRFYAIHARRPGTEDWWVRHVTKDEAIAAGRVTQEWADQRMALWGEDSAVYKNRVEGEFASASEDGVIPLAWVEAANERWREQYVPDGATVPIGKSVHPQLGSRRVLVADEKLHTIGVDVARGGEDRTVLALRQGNTICELRRLAFTEDTMVTAAQVTAVQRGHGEPKAVVDVIGVGAGVYDRLREDKMPCSPFNSSAAIKRHDQSGEFGFTNKRSWGWWNLREMLDPANACDVGLPPDDYLTGDLLAPKYRVMAGGRLQVESKDEIRKRLGRSTDSGDAVVYAMSESGGSWADLYRSDEEIAEAIAAQGDVPQPKPKPSRSGGWEAVYEKRDKPEAIPSSGVTIPDSGSSGHGAEERQSRNAPCRCGNLRRPSGDDPGHDADGHCLEPGCPCSGFTARS